jgi:hypothetical protein
MKAYATDFVAYQEAVRTWCHRERMDNQFWAPMIGSVIMNEKLENGQTKYRGIPSGNVIEKQEFKIGDYKDTILIPMITELTQPPSYGQQYLVGAGEEVGFKYMRSFINQVGCVIKEKDGNMSEYRDKGALQSYKYVMDLLTTRMKVYDNAHIIGSIYEQHSNNVLEGIGVAPGGIGATAHYHPNMFVNNIATDGTSGSLAAVGTEKRNKTAAEINTAVETGYANLTYPSVYLLEAIAEKIEELRMKPITSWGGKPLFLYIVDTETFYRLRRDTTIKAGIDNAWTGAKNWNNPIFMYDMFVYDKFMVIKDTLTARSWDTTSDSFSGSTGHFYDLPTNPSSYENSCGIVLGSSALGWAMPGAAGRLHTKDEITNFEQNKEKTAFSIYGVTRGEFVPEDSLATYYAKKNTIKTFGGACSEDVINQSSMIVISLKD